jgi:hypothetical protein
VLVWDSGSNILSENSVKVVSLAEVSYSIVNGDIITSHIRYFVTFYCNVLYPIEVKLSVFFIKLI